MIDFEVPGSDNIFSADKMFSNLCLQIDVGDDNELWRALFLLKFFLGKFQDDGSSADKIKNDGIYSRYFTKLVTFFKFPFSHFFKFLFSQFVWHCLSPDTKGLVDLAFDVRFSLFCLRSLYRNNEQIHFSVLGSVWKPDKSILLKVEGDDSTSVNGGFTGGHKGYVYTFGIRLILLTLKMDP